MKSDEKVIEEIGKVSDEFFHLIPSDFQYKGFDRKCLYNWFKSAFEYTALKTRREAVEEAFRAIRIEKRDEKYCGCVIGEGCGCCIEDYNDAIYEINRKKEEFLMEK